MNNIKFQISVLTGIGSINKYESSIKGYFENIQKQTLFKGTEHIIVYKEGSSIFEEYQNFENIKFIKEEKSGVYNAGNQAILNSTTLFVTNGNVDDRRFPKANERKFIVLKKNEDVGLIYNGGIFTDKEDENIENLSHTIRHFQSTPPDHQMGDGSCACGPDPMWRKSLHEKVGYFNQDEFPSCADGDMGMAFKHIAKIKFGHVKEYLSLFYINPIGVGQQNEEDRKKQDRKILEKYNVNIPNEFKDKGYGVN